MNFPVKPISLIFICALFSIGCETSLFKNKKKQLPKVVYKTEHHSNNSNIKKNDLKNHIERVNSVEKCDLDLKSFVQDYSKKITDKTLSLKIKFEHSISEEDLLKKMIDVTKYIFAQQSCAIKNISFLSTLSKDSEYTAKTQKMDYEFFVARKISRAEWIKRYEFKKIPTTYSLMKQLMEYRKSKKFKKAALLIDKLLQNDSENLKLLLIKGNNFFDQDKFSKAIKVYDYIRNTHESSSVALFNTVLAEKKLGLFDKAIDHLKMIQMKQGYDLLKDINKDEVLMHLADCYYKKGNSEKALETLKDLTNKNAMDYYLMLAMIQRGQKQLDKAILTLKDAKKKFSTSEKLNYNLLILSLDAKNEKEAKDYYQELDMIGSDLVKDFSSLKWLSQTTTTDDEEEGDDEE